MKFSSIIVLVFLLNHNSFSQVVQNETVLLMGSRFDITVVAKDAATGDEYIALAIDEIKRIEKLISLWDRRSETAMINRYAGIAPFYVSKELFDLVARTKDISALSQGTFDITSTVMNDLWKFDGTMSQFPSQKKIRTLSQKIDYNKIILDSVYQTIFLQEKEMKIGFGAIGKGYAIKKASTLLKHKGVKSGFINAGGDAYAWGKQANGTLWQMPISNPKDKTQPLAWINLNNNAVATSGDSNKRITFNGKSYAHIIDPCTGYPVDNGLHSVIIIGENAEFADAIATTVFVLGEEVGLYLVNHLDNLEAVLVYENGDIITSDNATKWVKR